MAFSDSARQTSKNLVPCFCSQRADQTPVSCSSRSSQRWTSVSPINDLTHRDGLKSSPASAEATLQAWNSDPMIATGCPCVETELIMTAGAQSSIASGSEDAQTCGCTRIAAPLPPALR